MRNWWPFVIAFAGAGCGDESSHQHWDASAGSGWREAALITAIEASANEQMGPTVRGDGLELIFQSNRSGATGCGDLWRSMRTSTTSAFGAPTPLDGVNSTMCEGGATLRADGLELLFTRDSMSPAATIWRTTRATSADPFGTPTEVTELNIATAQLFPSLSGDGLTVVFQSASAPSGNMPVFQAERTSTSAAFGTPHALAELAMPNPGVGLGGDALTAIASSASLERLVAYTRTSVTDAFGAGTPISELLPNPMYKILSTPFVSRDGTEIFYARRNMGNHVEIWRAVRD